MTTETWIEFRGVYNWGGSEFARGDRAKPSNIGMSMDEARNLETNGIVRIIEKKV